MYQELNTFIIFPESNNIFNYVTFKCLPDELNNILIKEEMISPEHHYSEFSWVIFKDGEMIQG